MDRMSLLIDMQLLAAKYSHQQPWRPAITDLWVYDTLTGMYESDQEDEYWKWKVTPDEVMIHIMSDTKLFDLEYGYEQVDEELREYLIENDFIIDLETEQGE